MIGLASCRSPNGGEANSFLSVGIRRHIYLAIHDAEHVPTLFAIVETVIKHFNLMRIGQHIFAKSQRQAVAFLVLGVFGRIE